MFLMFSRIKKFSHETHKIVAVLIDFHTETPLIYIKKPKRIRTIRIKLIKKFRYLSKSGTKTLKG